MSAKERHSLGYVKWFTYEVTNISCWIDIFGCTFRTPRDLIDWLVFFFKDTADKTKGKSRAHYRYQKLYQYTKTTSVKVFISKTELFCEQFLTWHNLPSVGTVYKLYIFCNHVLKKTQNTLKKNEKWKPTTYWKYHFKFQQMNVLEKSVMQVRKCVAKVAYSD